MARIIFMGSPEIAVPSLQALHQAGHEIVAVVTQPDKPKGRGQGLAPPAVKVAAELLGLKVLQPTTLRTLNFAPELAQFQPEFLTVVAYGKILPREVLQVPSLAPINLHFSLLPKYRGASCVAQALINDDEETGVTTIVMDEGMDTGPILMKWSEPIRQEDTAETLSRRFGYDVPVLGTIPLDMSLREGGDAGKPIVEADPTAPAAMELSGVAERLAGRGRGLAGMQLGLTPTART